jgi:hypothetical protein
MARKYHIPIIILNWNGWEDMFKCLQSLKEQPEFAKVWLVDNGSTVDRSNECCRLLPGIRIIKHGENYGWAGGYNRALKIALSEGYEFAYLLNNDTTVDANFLTAAHEVMLPDDKLAAVGSMIAYADREWIKFDGDYHSPKQKGLDSSFNAQSRLTGEVNGSGMLVRLAAMQKNGFFDERFFCYHEEAEWCRRMTTHGWRIATALSSIIYHRCEGSDSNLNALYYRSRNQFLLIAQEKNRGPFISKLRLARGLLFAASNYSITAKKPDYHIVLAALRDGMQGRFGRREDRPLGLCWLAVGSIHTQFVWLFGKMGIRPSRIHLLWKMLTGSIFVNLTL